jgi:hypothetical protein
VIYALPIAAVVAIFGALIALYRWTSQQIARTREATVDMELCESRRETRAAQLTRIEDCVEAEIKALNAKVDLNNEMLSSGIADLKAEIRANGRRSA